MTHPVAGLIALGLGAWGVVAWWGDFGAVLRGLTPLPFVLVGMAAIGAGLTKTRRAVEPEDEDRDDRNAGTASAPRRRNVA